jgi:hypothetical protein
MERIQLEQAITQKKLEGILGVSPMTIYLWRKLEVDPLPYRCVPTSGGRHKNYFLLGEIKSWLTRNRPNLVKKLVGGTTDEIQLRGDPGVIPSLPLRLSA